MGNGIAGAQGRLQALADVLQHQVDGTGSAAIVDRAQVVDLQVDQGHGTTGSYRTAQAFHRQRPVGQAGQAVMQGVVRQLLLALGNLALHGIEGRRQQTQFVTALQRQRRLVVALADPLGRLRQRAHRLRHTAGEQQRPGQRGQQRDQRDQEDFLIQRGEGLHGRIQRTLQQRDDLAVAARGTAGEHQRLAQEALVEMLGHLQLAPLGGLEHQPDNARRQGARLGADQFPGLLVIDGEERHFEVGQRAQFRGEGVVHGEAHHHPGDRQRRQHGGFHQQVRLALQRHDQGRLLVAARLAQGLLITERRAVGLVRQGTGEDLAVHAQQDHVAGVDALAVVDQHRADGRRIAAGHRVAKAEVGRQQLHAVAQAPALHIQQAFEDPRAHVQLLACLAAHRVVGGHLDAEVQRADDHQQQQDQDTGDPCLETTAQFH